MFYKARFDELEFKLNPGVRDARTYHGVGREPGTKDNNLGILDVVHIAEQVILRQRHVEVVSTVRERAEETLGLGAPLVVVRWVEVLDAVLGRELDVVDSVVRMRVRAGNKDRT